MRKKKGQYTRWDIHNFLARTSAIWYIPRASLRLRILLYDFRGANIVWISRKNNLEDRKTITENL